MNSKTMIFARCCYGYGVSGMAVLVIGAVLPAIIQEAGLSYTIAGGMLSMMALGNLCASLFFPVMCTKFGKRLSITLVAALVPVCLFGLTLLPTVSIMYLLMFTAGVARGAITIINNSTVNIISNNSVKALNLLHCSFAIGAFLAPFLTSVLQIIGFEWRSILYLIIFLCTTSAVSYASMEYNQNPDTPASSSKSQANSAPLGFLKNPLFYCIGFILFFYLGTENCINGWFVTYLQSTGIMSQTYATNMVSVTWLVIMIGRLVCASLSKRYPKGVLILINAIGSCFFFFLLVFSTQLVAITAALIGMGFFLSGIYPTCIAAAGPYIKGSTAGMAFLTAISALGGILAPQIIGSAADKIGIVAAISVLSINAIMVVILACCHLKGSKLSNN